MSDFVSSKQSIFLSSRILFARHPLVAFFVIAFLGTWLVDLPTILSQEGLGLMGYHMQPVLYLILFIMASFAGPTLGAVLVTGAVEGMPGVRAFFRRYGQWRVNVRWYVISLLGVPLVYLISAVILLGPDVFHELVTNWLTLFSVYLPAVLIFPAVITWGEEPGWSGFALTQMQQRYRPIIASMVVGFFHGVWRLPVFLIVNGPGALGPFNLGRFLITVAAIMMVTILWAWVFNHAAGSILLAVLVHAAFNASQIWIVSLVPNFSVEAGYTSLGIFLLIAINIAITNKNLGYRPVLLDRARKTEP